MKRSPNFIHLNRLLAATLTVAAILFSSHAYAEAATPSRLAVQSLLLDGAQSNGLMVVVGDRGHILYSTDQGHNWTQSEVPTQVLLTAVHLFDDKQGWAVGHDAVILKTMDGAKTWQKVYSAPEEETPLLDVWFRDAQNGFAMGGYGLFLETQDGGGSWNQRWLNDTDDFHLNHMTQLPDGSLFIAAEAGIVYLSTDGGENWQSPPSPYHGSFFGSLPIGDKSQLLFGLRGHLFRTDDGGEQWQQVETQTTALLTAGLKSQQGDCYISGLSGVMLIAPDCKTENITLKQLPGRNGISAILEGDNALVLVGEAGVTRFQP